MKKIFLISIVTILMVFSVPVFASKGTVKFFNTTRVGPVPVNRVCPMYPQVFPPKGCFYENTVSSNWCKIPKLVCNNGTGIGAINAWTWATITWTKVCPLNPLKKAPKWCFYKTSIGKNWCENNTLICATTSPVCPLNPIKKAPKWCRYINNTNSQGCKISKLVCYPIDPIRPPVCPLNPIKKAPKWCVYEYKVNKNWCEVGRIVCAVTWSKTWSILSPIKVLKKNYWLSRIITRKVDFAINKLTRKLDIKYKDSVTKTKYLQKIISKLKSVSKIKPKYSNLISYLVDWLQMKIDSYSTTWGVTSILDILK